MDDSAIEDAQKIFLVRQQGHTALLVQTKAGGIFFFVVADNKELKQAPDILKGCSTVLEVSQGYDN